MTSKELNEVAHAWMNSFNAKNLEKLLLLYDDEAEHFSPKLKVRHPETGGLLKGKKALRTWWRDAFDRLPTLSYELVRLTAEDNRVFMEYIRHVSGEEDLYVGEMLEVKGGHIVASAVFHR